MTVLSEKWAAPLLVVAVLAGTCDAQFDISNLCNRTIVVSTGTSINMSVVSGTTGNIITLPPASFFNGLVNISIPDTTHVPLTIPVPARVISFLDSLFGLRNIAISCSGSCVSLPVTFTVLTQMAVPLGPFCLPSLPPPPSVPLPTLPPLTQP